jgi:hypothetical protein
LNSAVWNYTLPFSDSSLSVGGGVLTLNNRATISTVQQVDSPVTITGSLMASQFDIVRFSTRSDLGVFDPTYGELNGLHFTFHFDSNSIQISDANYNELAFAPYTFHPGQSYNFALADDGSNLSFSIDGVQQLTAVDNTPSGNYVSIYNRGTNGWAIPSTTQFDNIQINGILLGAPEPGRLALLFSAFLMIYFRRTRL